MISLTLSAQQIKQKIKQQNKLVQNENQWV